MSADFVLRAVKESVPLLSPSFWWLLAIFGISQIVDSSPQSLPVCSHGYIYTICIYLYAYLFPNFPFLEQGHMRLVCMCMCTCARLLQSCLTLCYPMDCSPPGSTVHRILQAKIVEWVAIPFSRGSSRPRD